MALRPTPCSESGDPPRAITSRPNSRMASCPAFTSASVRGITFGWTLPSDTWPQIACGRPRRSKPSRYTRIISPKRSNGTIMSAAVFWMPGSTCCFATATRRFTASGADSRKSKNCCARARSPGTATSTWSRTPAPSSSRQKTPSGVASPPGSSADAIWSYACSPVVPAGSSSCTSSATSVPAGSEMPCLASLPSSWSIARHGRSSISMAETSSPRGSFSRHVRFDRSRNSATTSSACASPAKGTSARHVAGAGATTPSVASTIDPERALRADEEVDEVHARRGEVAGGALGRRRASRKKEPAPERRQPRVSTSNQPSGCARTCPRSMSRTSPDASTTVSPRTQSRVLPYLNVAAPDALVEMVPPTNAPSYVGAGG